MKRAMASAGHCGAHVQVLLGAYLLGGLSADEEVAVRAHLDRCVLCRAEHDELACVPAWLDLLKESQAAGGLDLVTDVMGDDLEAGDEGGAG